MSPKCEKCLNELELELEAVLEKHPEESKREMKKE